MSEEQSPDRFWSAVDIPKTLAGALAAVCAAVVGSYLGVAGTLIGAAVASVVGTVGTEVYDRSFRRGAQRLQTLAPTFVRAPAAIGTPPVAAATVADSPSHTVPVDDPDGDGTPDKSDDTAGQAEIEAAGGPATGTVYTAHAAHTAGGTDPIWRRIRWSRVAVVAGAAFVLAMGALTVTELVTGHSVATSVGNGTAARTTLSGVFHPGNGPASPSPAASPAPSAQPSTADGGQATAPGTAPGSAVPSATPSATASPSTVPTATGAATTPPPAAGLHQIQPGQTSGVTGP